MTLLLTQYKCSQYKTKSLSIRWSRVNFIVIYSLGGNNLSKHTNRVQFFFVSQKKISSNNLRELDTKAYSLLRTLGGRGTERGGKNDRET